MYRRALLLKDTSFLLCLRLRKGVYSPVCKSELFYHEGKEGAHKPSELTSTRQLRGAFSDTEDFLDHGLVSANRCSSRTSSISSWTENIKPSFTKKLKFQSALEGEPVELKCKLVAYPPPTVLWFHNNRSVLKERRRRICTDSRIHMHTTSLVIDSIKEKDSGSYKVMAINTEGSAESTASLLVSLREEQSANYLGFVRCSAKAHQSIDTMAEQRKERKIRVELRCVGSPFDKMSKIHQGRSRSKTALVRTVYFRSGSLSRENESGKESKCLETASERAPSPRPMFDRSEHFNDRFSDIYCDRRTGARFSDKFSDRCSDRYSERFSDTESLHNEVRTKLTTLQKAVKQKKRLSISTMSSSEFESESVASESSYADYVERLRVKPASLPDVQHGSRPCDLGESHREFQGKSSSGASSQTRVRHSFEPQSRTRAIQIMRGELVDTLVTPAERQSEVKDSQGLEGKEIVSLDELQAGDALKQMDSECPFLAAEHKVEATKGEVTYCEALTYSETSTHTESKESVRCEPVPEEASLTESLRSKPITSHREKFVSEAVTPTDKFNLYEEEGAGESLRAKYEKSLEAERMECEEKLLALRIRKWQQGSRMLEQETYQPEADLPMWTETEYRESAEAIYTQQEVAGKGEAKATPSSFHRSSRIHPRVEDPETAIFSTTKYTMVKSREDEVETVTSFHKMKTVEGELEEMKSEAPHTVAQKSPRLTGRATDLEAAVSPRIKARSRPDKDFKEPGGVGRETAEQFEEESLRTQYEKSLEDERMVCEEKLLALRIRKWQQGSRMSEGETMKPERDLPAPAETIYMEPGIYTQQQAAEKRATAHHVGMSPKSEGKISASSFSAGMKGRELELEAPVLMSNTSSQIKARAAELEEQPSPTTKARTQKTGDKRELQLSRENLSELKNDREKFVSEEEALTQRIMKWQQDVLMEQEQTAKAESEWVEGYASFQPVSLTENRRDIAQAFNVESNSASEFDSSRQAKTEKGKEKVLTRSSITAQKESASHNQRWPTTAGRETRLQKDSEYFVSEEEALAQRILKWQQDIVEQEEVVELETEWTLHNQYRQAGASFNSELSHGEASHPSHLPPPHTAGAGGSLPSAPPLAADYKPSPHTSTTHGGLVQCASQTTDRSTVKDQTSGKATALDCDRADDQSSSPPFQSKVRDERGKREDNGTTSVDSGSEERTGELARSTRGEMKSPAEDPGLRTFRKGKKEDHSPHDKEMEGNRFEGSCPEFVKEINSVKVKIGEMTEFKCQFQSEPLPTVTWLKDGQSLADSPDYDIVSRSNMSRLTLFYPTTDHEGKYECVITNKHGKSVSSGTLQILGRETLKTLGVRREKKEQNQESMTDEELKSFVDSGKTMLQVPQTVIHKCRCSNESFSSSPVEIRITSATPVPEMTEESSEDTPRAFLEETSDVPSDGGASQNVKHKCTLPFHVTSEAPEVISESVSSEGNTAVLECVIEGEPASEVAWYHNESCLDTTSGKYRIDMHNNICRLHINNFTFSDAGVYKCVARNGLGQVTSMSHLSCQVAEHIQVSEGGGVGEEEESPVSLAQDFNTPAKMVSCSAEDRIITKEKHHCHTIASKARPGPSREPLTISGCGLQGSAVVIKVSQIKQAFESESPVTLAAEEHRRETRFPEELIPPVAVSLDQREDIIVAKPDNMLPGSPPLNPGSPKTGLARAEQDFTQTVPVAGSSMSSVEGDSDALEGAETLGIVKQFVEAVQESPELVRPKPQKPDHFQIEPDNVQRVREETVRTFDRSSSFIPFQSEKAPGVKRSLRTSATTPTQEAVRPKRLSESFENDRQSSAVTCVSTHSELEDVSSACAAEEKRETKAPSDENVPLSEEERVREEAEVPEHCSVSGVSLSMPDSQRTVTAERVAHPTIRGADELIDVHLKEEPELCFVKPVADRRGKILGLPVDASALDKASAAEARASHTEEEQVTFGAVYDYYNPPADWGRPLSPESEMSIEIGSTVSEDIAEVAERFYTPGSSTEVSQPIVESHNSSKSPPSFQTPSSNAPLGFMTPQEYPFSPVEHKRPSTGESVEMLSPVHFLTPPADEYTETTPPGLSVDENRFLSKGRGALGLPTLQEKVQGIPPAFLKPLVKKRVSENDSLTFSAEVFGLPSPEVRWFCNKSQVVADDRVKIERDGDTISLTIDNVTKADQGEYICEALNYVGEAKSVALVVVVSQEVKFMPAPPAVTHQHVMEFDVEEGDSRSPSPQEILLEVELDEIEVKEFEKQIKIITIPEYTADNKSMILSLDVLPSIYEEGAVDFVTQEVDDLKIAFEVIEMPPRFINPICDMEAPEGTTVLFECSLMGIPSPIVSWFKGGQKIPHSNKKYLYSSDGDNHFLKICKVTAQDSGLYTCRAINLVGETLCRASLVVLNAKAFSGKTRGRELTAVSLGSAKLQPQKFDLVVGNTSFDGEQVSEIELEFEFEHKADESQRAVRLVANTDSEMNEQGEKFVSVNFDVFAEPAKDDKIEFKGKSSEMCSFQFQVTETPPKCIIPLTTVTAAVGTPVILQCLVSGKPGPTAEWYKDGERVTDSRCLIQEKAAGHFNLLITNVTQSDAGEYKCRIQNAAGGIETTALLKVL